MVGGTNDVTSCVADIILAIEFLESVGGFGSKENSSSVKKLSDVLALHFE